MTLCSLPSVANPTKKMGSATPDTQMWLIPFQFQKGGKNVVENKNIMTHKSD